MFSGLISLNFENGTDCRHNLKIDAALFQAYTKEFAGFFSEHTQYYRLVREGDYVEIETNEISYGEMEEIAKNLNASRLVEENVLRLNSTLPYSKFTRYAWISLYQCLLLEEHFNQYIFPVIVQHVERLKRNPRRNGVPRQKITLINLYTAETVRVWEDEFSYPLEQFTNGETGFVVANDLKVEDWVVALQQAFHQRKQ